MGVDSSGVTRTEDQEAAVHQPGDRRIDPLAGRRLSWRAQFGHDLPAVRDNNCLSGPNLSHILTEAILQLAQTDSLHALNVATRGHIVNFRT